MIEGASATVVTDLAAEHAVGDVEITSLLVGLAGLAAALTPGLGIRQQDVVAGIGDAADGRRRLLGITDAGDRFSAWSGVLHRPANRAGRASVASPTTTGRDQDGECGEPLAQPSFSRRE